MHYIHKIAYTVLGLLVIGAGVLLYMERQKVTEIKENPQKIAQESVRDVIAEVGELMVLPEGETPTVATVSDPTKLKDQAFFANAKEGDRVLIYTNAKKAILYDMENKKIVEVAPLYLGNNAPAATPVTAPTPTPVPAPAATSTHPAPTQ